MKIKGLQKLTLLDYPEKMACTVFTHGCNFRCPFCHNASLVLRPGEVEGFSEDEVQEMLSSDFFAMLALIKSGKAGNCTVIPQKR